MRPRITYANTMATLALMLTMGGTALAAVTITGRNVADRSLTSADVKNGSLNVVDLSLTAKNALRGAKGDTGRIGSQGTAGPIGADGGRGPRGSAAFMTSAFAHRDTGVITSRVGVSPPNDNADALGANWDDPLYADNDDPAGIPQIRAEGQYTAINLTNQYQPVLSLTGNVGADTRSADDLLKLTFTEAYLNATASLSFLHRAHNENLTSNTGGTSLHGRLECRLFYGTSTDPSQLITPAGMPAQASGGAGGLRHELINVALNGNARNLVAGTNYNVTVKCRDADYTGKVQWQLARGNLTALASR